MFRKILKLTATGLLVVGVTASAYFAGYGAGSRVQAYPIAPAAQDTGPDAAGAHDQLDGGDPEKQPDFIAVDF